MEKSKKRKHLKKSKNKEEIEGIETNIENVSSNADFCPICGNLLEL